MSEFIDNKHCPSCGSDQLIKHGSDADLSKMLARAWGNTVDCPITQCGVCSAFREPWPDNTPLDNVERPPCDNCAYRAGSGEARNRETWKELVQRADDAVTYGLKDPRGRRWFSCHKGVPIKITQGDDAGVEFDFAGSNIDPLNQTCAGFLTLMWAIQDKRDGKDA